MGVAPSASGLGRMAGWCYDHRRRVLVGWIVGLVAFTALAQVVGTHFDNKFTSGHNGSSEAQTLLQDRFPTESGAQGVVVFDTATPISANVARITQLVDALGMLPHVASVTSPVAPGHSYQVARDGHIAYATVNFNTTSDKLSNATVNKVIDV